MRTLPRDENGTAIRGVRPKKTRPKSYGAKLGYTAKKNLLDKTRQFVKDYMSQPQFDASHDYNHVQRVVALSLEILRVEQNAFRKVIFDGTIIELLALMHDIDDHKYRPPANETDGYPSPPSNLDPHSQPISFDIGPSNPTQDPSLPAPPNIDPNLQYPAPSAVEAHLLQLGWPGATAARVGTLATFVSYTAETSNKPGYAAALAQSPELAIVQDADRLDAIGAVGIGRAFTYGGAKGRDGGLAETMNHFEEKLAKLEGMMKTGEGRRLAVMRAERLRIFGRWWQEEMRMVGMLGADGMEWIQSISPWIGQGPPDATPGPSGEPNPTSPNQANQSMQAPEAQDSNEYQHAEVAHMTEAQSEESSEGNLPQQETQYQDPGSQLMEAIQGSV